MDPNSETIPTRRSRLLNIAAAVFLIAAASGPLSPLLLMRWSIPDHWELLILRQGYALLFVGALLIQTRADVKLAVASGLIILYSVVFFVSLLVGLSLCR